MTHELYHATPMLELSRPHLSGNRRGLAHRCRGNPPPN